MPVHPRILVIVVMLALSALACQRAGPQDVTQAITPEETPRVEPGGSAAVAAGKQLSGGQCRGTDKPKLGTSPMRPEDFRFIIPYGAMIGGHVTPIDHQYFSPAEFDSPRDAYDVVAMANATIVGITSRTNSRGTEYRLVFSMSCTLFYYYDLLTSLAPDIQKAYDAQRINIPVEEGQLIGRIGGQTLDFAVWDMDVRLGFIVPEHYAGESWKIHTADPLDYYTDEFRAFILSRYVRTAEPVSGKIDYDIDGRAAGNWFEEGTDGYGGGGVGSEYYRGHLSLSYDAFDPSSIVFSVGSYPGLDERASPSNWPMMFLMQFGVKGNSPDPKDISVDTGLVRYELVQKDWADAAGNYWGRMTLITGVLAKNHEDRLWGTALVQMLADRRLKAEVFPGKAAQQVTGFSEQAVVYER